jgi:transketolase
MKQNDQQLSIRANDLRQAVISMLATAGSGHTAGPLGLAELFAVLYFDALRLKPKDPTWEGRDRLILSAGHLVPLQYVAMAQAGFFPTAELKTLRRLNSRLQGHPSRVDLPGIEAAAGPLGQGLSVAVGMALAGQLDQADWRVYCVSSDGEFNEGQAWEALMAAAKYHLGNLTVFLDRNQIQIDGTTEQIMPLEPLTEKLQSFRWHVMNINGHSIAAIRNAIQVAQHIKHRPTMIVLHTTPGKGVDFMEKKYEWHGQPPTPAEAKIALAELRSLRGKIERSDHD